MTWALLAASEFYRGNWEQRLGWKDLENTQFVQKRSVSHGIAEEPVSLLTRSVLWKRSCGVYIWRDDLRNLKNQQDLPHPRLKGMKVEVPFRDFPECWL